MTTATRIALACGLCACLTAPLSAQVAAPAAGETSARATGSSVRDVGGEDRQPAADVRSSPSDTAIRDSVTGNPTIGDTTAADSLTGEGQQRRVVAPRQAVQRPRAFGVAGFVTFGQTSFTAKDSFEAILDTSSGTIFGGGGQVWLPYHLFARVDVTRFEKDGERAFVSNGQVFKLGIPTTVTVTPIEFTGGYRHPLTFGRRPRAGGPAAPAGGFRLIPFIGGGVGVLQYGEKADFAEPGDDVSESFTSYHIVGGVEVPVWRWISVGAEYHHRWVPDALGESGVSAAFEETDLGGRTFRFRVIVGF